MAERWRPPRFIDSLEAVRWSLDDLAKYIANLPTGGGGGLGALSKHTATPTISTSAYAAHDQVGGLMEFTNVVATAGDTAMIRGVTITDKTLNLRQLDLYLFDRSITVAGDNNAAAHSDADNLFSEGAVSVYPSDYTQNANGAVANRRSVGMPVRPNGTSLFGYLVIRAATTYTSTSDLQVSLYVEAPA